MLIDTHCHIHNNDYPLEVSEVLAHAKLNNVGQMVCIGTDIDDSVQAIKFAGDNENIFATVGIHPHYAKNGHVGIEKLIDVSNPSLVAVGEIGLDYYYNHSSKQSQFEVLEFQIDLALNNNLPIVFHVREAFDDFWPIYDNFHGISGVVHCFTDMPVNVEKCLSRDLMIGVGGFSTFTKNEIQKEMFASLPLDKIILETDAPYLTPAPLRGNINEPAFVWNIADYLARIKNVSVQEISNSTTINARKLFKLEK